MRIRARCRFDHNASGVGTVGVLEKHTPCTGLGPNSVSSIVTAHDGAVTSESEIEGAAPFQVTMPHPTFGRDPPSQPQTRRMLQRAGFLAPR